MGEISFVFYIDDVFDIRKDPGGHYRHFHILVGRLRSGKMRVSDKIQILSLQGTISVTKIWCFEQRQRDPGKEVSAMAEFFGIYTRGPALNPTNLRGSTAVICPPERYEPIILDMLQREPKSFLHYQGENAEHGYCFECITMLNTLSLQNLDSALTLLQQLTSHPDEEVANGAIRAIAYLSK